MKDVPIFKNNITDIMFPLNDRVAGSLHDLAWLNEVETKAIVFGQGSFDLWCAYLIALNPDPSDNRWYAFAAKDAYYFERLYFLGTRMDEGLTLKKVYGHLMHLFELALRKPGVVDMDAISYIYRVSKEHYACWAGMAREMFFHVYYGMIAEENKANTRLGCLIKIHGLHELLIGQRPVDIASNCTRGLSWHEIQAECDAYGLVRYV